MRRRVKKIIAPENGETKMKLSSKCQKAKSRNASSERPMAADDIEVDDKKSKVSKVKTQTVKRKRKTAHIGYVTDGPAHVGCDDTGHGIKAAGSADADVGVKNVTNSAEFEPSPVNPDCISPATKLAKQLRCFKEKQTSSLALGGDAALLDVGSASRHPSKDFTSVARGTNARARKCRGYAVRKKCLNTASDYTVFSSSSPTDATNSTDKRRRTNTGGRKGKNGDGSSVCPDSQTVRKGRTNSCGDRTVVTRKRPAKRNVESSVVRTAAAKTAKCSRVDNNKSKSLRKRCLGKRKADVCGPSDVAETDIAPTGEASFSVPSSAAGPSVEGDTGSGSSDSESDWEEVEGNYIWLRLLWVFL